MRCKLYLILLIKIMLSIKQAQGFKKWVKYDNYIEESILSNSSAGSERYLES